GFPAERSDEGRSDRSFGDLEKASLLTIRGGMQELCDRLADELGPSLHLDTTVSSLEPLFGKYDRVISTLPSYVLSGLVPEPLRTCLQSVEYAHIAPVLLNIEDELEVPEGFGYLVASNQE